MAVCSKCGKEQYYGESFCFSCGAPVIAEGKPRDFATSNPARVENTDTRCPHCGAGLADASRFCVSCGAEIQNANGRHETQVISEQENAELYPCVRKINRRMKTCLLIGSAVFLLFLILAHDIFLAALTMGILLWVIPYGLFYLVFRLILLRKAQLTGKQYRSIRKEMKKLPRSVSHKTN